jgi:hypothetical protein
MNVDNTDKKGHSLAVLILMQGCIVTSRFSDILENREGRLSSREELVCQWLAWSLPRNSAKNRFFAAPVRSIP